MRVLGFKEVQLRAMKAKGLFLFHGLLAPKTMPVACVRRFG